MSSKLDEIEARLKAATPGPWAAVFDENHPRIVPDVDCSRQTLGTMWRQQDLHFVAGAPTDLAYLLALVRSVADAECQQYVADPATGYGTGYVMGCGWANRACWPCRMRKELEK